MLQRLLCLTLGVLVLASCGTTSRDLDPMLKPPQLIDPDEAEDKKRSAMSATNNRFFA